MTGVQTCALQISQRICRNVRYDEKYNISAFSRGIDMLEIAIRRLLWGKK